MAATLPRLQCVEYRASYQWEQSTEYMGYGTDAVVLFVGSEVRMHLNIAEYTGYSVEI